MDFDGLKRKADACADNFRLRAVDLSGQAANGLIVFHGIASRIMGHIYSEIG